MVGVEGGESHLAQVVIVNSFGNVIYNKYVLPRERVLDYRTKWSGIEKHHLQKGNGGRFSIFNC
jgi:RNA exonuclease 4